MKQLFSIFRKNKSQKVLAPQLQELEGAPEYRQIFPTHKITYRFIPYATLKEIDTLRIFAEELNVPISIVRRDLSELTKTMNHKLTICIEYPYVDELYRDTYYSFYARKHANYNRFCFRLSFFKNDVNEDNFYDIDLEDKYYGYVVLRPTPKRIIGYTFLNPSVYSDHHFSVCLCERASFIKGRKVVTTAFPFAGQDGEMTTCAETAATMLFDYFSRRYNKYSRLLPSQIADQLSNNVVDRKQPSVGIDVDTMASVMNTFGVNTRQYYVKEDDDTEVRQYTYSKEDFNRLLHIYVESGIPIYLATKTHAKIVIGRQNRLFAYESKMIVMDDNKRPYTILDNTDDVISFVVPMPDNILLDVDELDPCKKIKALSEDYPAAKISINENNENSYEQRIFLTTSRSYKSYIVESNLGPNVRDAIMSISMPRFVWVCESFKKDAVKKIPSIIITNVAVFDSTDYSSNYNNILMLKSDEKLVIPSDDKVLFKQKAFSVLDAPDILHPFNNNLKGEAVKWRC